MNAVAVAVDSVADVLLARIAEDEAAARTGEKWGYDVTLDDGATRTAFVFDGNGRTIAAARDGATVAHIARHDPAHVLAECAAKRQLVTMWQEAHANPEGTSDTEAVLDEVLQTLAAAYTDKVEHHG